MKLVQLLIVILCVQFNFSQSKNQYHISFENAVHHEAKIQATFSDLKTATISLRMSRTSPGRYALHEFANDFFTKYINNSKVPDYKTLFANFGISMVNSPKKVYFAGVPVKFENKDVFISDYPKKGSPAYTTGLDKDDVILTINEDPITDEKQLSEVLKKYIPGKKVTITYKRLGKEVKTEMTFSAHPDIETKLLQNASKEAINKRENWLKSK
ncbi:PDZ domain-containing protein [Aquimarina sp. AU58]|uniref:PDZ domain-containing protein n=1 Tax=Aquimarina sp. AU58 TaxID=1874112 RepID=UPI000D65D8B1|nr:PDZ domain-containing protein [Aquimarina sp. AU58]